MVTFSEGLRNSNFPLKERRRHMKNEAFRVNCMVTFFVVYLPTRCLTLVFFSELGTYLGVADDHRDALKAKEGEVVDLRREMEGLRDDRGDSSAQSGFVLQGDGSLESGRRVDAA